MSSQKNERKAARLYKISYVICIICVVVIVISFILKDERFHAIGYIALAIEMLTIFIDRRAEIISREEDEEKDEKEAASDAGTETEE